MPSSDAELLVAWRAGDSEAGSALFERYFASLYRFFRGKAPDVVDDLIQRSLLACVERRDTIRDAESFRGYLFAIARNELNQYYRRAGRGPELDLSVESAASLLPTPSALLAAQREQRVVLEALRRIPVDSQIALELYYWESLTATEIGAVLGIPTGTARSRIRRAKELLEERIEDVTSDPALVATTTASLETWARSLKDCFEISTVDLPRRD